MKKRLMTKCLMRHEVPHQLRVRWERIRFDSFKEKLLFGGVKGERVYVEYGSVKLK